MDCERESSEECHGARRQSLPGILAHHKAQPKEDLLRRVSSPRSTVELRDSHRSRQLHPSSRRVGENALTFKDPDQEKSRSVDMRETLKGLAEAFESPRKTSVEHSDQKE